MDREALYALINNVALLLSLSIIYEITYLASTRLRRLQPYISGCFIAIICIIIMSVPFTLQSGIIFDTRSILISVTALTFGPIPTVIVVIAALAARIVISGAGTLSGIAVIISRPFSGALRAGRREAGPISSGRRARGMGFYKVSAFPCVSTKWPGRSMSLSV